MCNVKFKIKRPGDSGTVICLQKMSYGIRAFLCADKLFVSCKSMLTGFVGFAINKAVIFIVTSYIGKKDRGVAVPECRIRLPENLLFFFFVINFYKFSSMVINLYQELFVFQCSVITIPSINLIVRGVAPVVSINSVYQILPVKTLIFHQYVTGFS